MNIKFNQYCKLSSNGKLITAVKDQIVSIDNVRLCNELVEKGYGVHPIEQVEPVIVEEKAVVTSEMQNKAIQSDNIENKEATKKKRGRPSKQ